MEYYYTAKFLRGGTWQAQVYHWSEDNMREIFDYQEDGFSSATNAINAAANWAEDHELDAELV